MSALITGEETMKETITRDCECWEHTASLNFIGEGVPKEAIRHIYCPVCSEGIRKDEGCMTEERGWLIEYDPKLIKPASTTVYLAQDGKTPASFLIYMDTGRL